MQKRGVQSEKMLSKRWQIVVFFLTLSASGFSSDRIVDRIVGVWYAYDEDGVRCNHCPDYVFKSDKTGFIRYPDQRIENFDWRADSCLHILKDGRDDCYTVESKVKGHHLRFLLRRGSHWIEMSRSNITLAKDIKHKAPLIYQEEEYAELLQIILLELQDYCKERHLLVNGKIQVPFDCYTTSDSLLYCRDAAYKEFLGRNGVATDFSHEKRWQIAFCISEPQPVSDGYVCVPIISFTIEKSDVGFIAYYNEDLSRYLKIRRNK